MQRRYNWKPDLPDFRDKLYKLPEKMSLESLPALIDLRPECSPVVNQGQIGSCTGNAIAGALEFLELREEGAKRGPDYFGSDFQPISRLFIYWNERAMEGDPHQDAGAMIRDGITSVQTWGVCREYDWEYDPSKLFMCPRPTAYAQATRHKNIQAARLDNQNLLELRHCLSEGFPFVFGMSVYQSFESPQTTQSGIVYMPFPNETLLGGHALLCVGYNDEARVFIVKNSWGAWWGSQGYCYIPYDYLTNPNLADDFWVIQS